MARRGGGHRVGGERGSGRRGAGTPSIGDAGDTAKPAPLRVALGAICLAVSAVAAGMLVWGHFSGMSLPGCGADSPCARAAVSAWGKIPGTAIPVSFPGLAYFASMLAVWLATRGRLSRGLEWLVRLGALASVVFLVVAAIERLPCAYCIASHAGGLGFWLASEWMPRPRPRRAADVAWAVGGILLVGGGLMLGQAVRSQTIAKDREKARAASTAEIIDATKRQAAAAQTSAPASGAAPAPTPAGGATVTISSSPPEAKPFTGRWRMGPERAKVRVVMFMGYQCPDCKRVDAEAMSLAASTPGVSLSVKHFPLSSQCNPMMLGKNPHPNACWAARAAEAAGILYGEAGFWRMHQWLFSRGGAFTDGELDQGLSQLGFDRNRFISTMTGAETSARVKGDIDEGIALGLFFTPMVFVNGVELRGWQTQGALSASVQAVLASNPPELTSSADQPVAAPEKYVADWREWPALTIAPQAGSYAQGEVGAPAVVRLFGDATDALSGEMEASVRALAAKYPGKVRFEARQYPYDSSCNPALKTAMSPSGCLAARAIEAAGLLGGGEKWWAMRAWVGANAKAPITPETLGAAAAGMGLDPAAFGSMLNGPVTTTAVNVDIQTANAAGLTSFPALVVNNRLVPRWKLEGQDVLGRFIEEAVRGGGTGGGAAAPGQP